MLLYVFHYIGKCDKINRFISVLLLVSQFNYKSITDSFWASFNGIDWFFIRETQAEKFIILFLYNLTTMELIPIKIIYATISERLNKEPIGPWVMHLITRVIAKKLPWLIDVGKKRMYRVTSSFTRKLCQNDIASMSLLKFKIVIRQMRTRKFDDIPRIINAKVYDEIYSLGINLRYFHVSCEMTWSCGDYFFPSFSERKF